MSRPTQVHRFALWCRPGSRTFEGITTMMERFDAALRAGDVPRLHALITEATSNGVGLSDLEDANGNHLAHLAVQYGTVSQFTTAFSPLLAADAQAFLEACNAFDERPLHLAAAKGDAQAVRRLLQHGASVAALDNFGNSVLHHAAVGGSVAVAQTLLEAGLQPGYRNRLDETPGDVARTHKKHEVAYVVDQAARGAALAVHVGLAGRASHTSSSSADTGSPGHWTNVLQAFRSKGTVHAAPASSASVQSAGSSASKSGGMSPV